MDEEKQQVHVLTPGDMAKDVVLRGNDEIEVGQWMEANCGAEIRRTYFEAFISNGYASLDFIKEIDNVNSLIEIGIEDHIHQNMILAEIMKLKKLFDGD